MEIRIMKQEAYGHRALAEHARRELLFRLMHHGERIAHVTVKLGDSGSRRGRRETYCVMQLQVRGVPAATVVDIGADAYSTIGRAADRVSRLAAEQLRLGGARERASGLRQADARNPAATGFLARYPRTRANGQPGMDCVR